MTQSGRPPAISRNQRYDYAFNGNLIGGCAAITGRDDTALLVNQKGIAKCWGADTELAAAAIQEYEADYSRKPAETEAE